MREEGKEPDERKEAAATEGMKGEDTTKGAGRGAVQKGALPEASRTRGGGARAAAGPDVLFGPSMFWVTKPVPAT